MAESDCLPQVHACVIRIAALEADGVPLPGAGNLYVADAFAKILIKPVYDDGTEIKEKNACDAVAVDFTGPPSFTRADVEVDLLTADPYLQAILSGKTMDVLDGPDGPGLAYPPIGVLLSDGISIEFWAKRINNGSLDADAPYAWWVLPRVTNLRVGDTEHSATALKPPYTGQAYENPNWFDGPLNDWPEASDRCVQWIPTTSIPDVTCGPQALVAS